MDPSSEIELRDDAFEEAQKARLDGDTEKEQELMAEYWLK